MKNRRMAVLVTSCDAYEDIWDPFFILMDRYWTDIPYEVYLNTEWINYRKQYKNFFVQSINQSTCEKVTWSKRMLDVLEQIDEEYVFILVEDFFLRERVQTELLESILDKMDEDMMLGQVQLFGTRINCDHERANKMSDRVEWEQLGDDKAKVVFVPTIWRKETLQRWLRPHESIWAFESLASQRARRWKYKEKVYRVQSPAIFNYLWEKDCYCVVNGKWMLHPLLEKLFEENNICVDYQKRGTITMEEWQAVTLITIIKRNGILGIAKKVIGRVKSVF